MLEKNNLFFKICKYISENDIQCEIDTKWGLAFATSIIFSNFSFSVKSLFRLCESMMPMPMLILPFNTSGLQYSNLFFQWIQTSDVILIHYTTNWKVVSFFVVVYSINNMCVLNSMEQIDFIWQAIAFVNQFFVVDSIIQVKPWIKHIKTSTTYLFHALKTREQNNFMAENEREFMNYEHTIYIWRRLFVLTDRSLQTTTYRFILPTRTSGSRSPVAARGRHNFSIFLPTKLFRNFRLNPLHN